MEILFDLFNYIKNKKIDKLSNGMHTVCKKFTEKGIESGVIFVLKNINETVNIGNINRMHPFYIVYISEDGQILSDYLNVKNTLDILSRML